MRHEPEAALKTELFSERGLKILKRAMENELGTLQECLDDPDLEDRQEHEAELLTVAAILTHLGDMANG